MNAFKRFTDIENVSRTNFIQSIVEQGFADPSIEWVVSSKLDGANLSLYYDGKEFNVASRSQMLGRGSGFAAVDHNWLDLEQQAAELWEVTGAKETLCVHGEWIGGVFPGEPHREYTKKIQGRVFYSPNNHFVAFNLIVDGKLYDVDSRIAAFQKAEMHYAGILFRGTFEECLQYPNDGVEDFCIRFGLVPPEGNIREGVVLEPVIPSFLRTGSRIILKNKNDKFSETRGPKTPREPIVLSDAGHVYYNKLSEYVTDSRVFSVTSKLGVITPRDFGKVLGLYVQDLLTDAEKDDVVAPEIDAKEEKAINKAINKLASEEIRKEWINIIDGEV